MTFHIQPTAQCPLEPTCLCSFSGPDLGTPALLSPLFQCRGEGLGATKPGQKEVLCRKGLEWSGKSP